MFEHPILSRIFIFFTTIVKITKQYFSMLNLEYWYIRVPMFGNASINTRFDRSVRVYGNFAYKAITHK